MSRLKSIMLLALSVWSQGEGGTVWGFVGVQAVLD